MEEFRHYHGSCAIIVMAYFVDGDTGEERLREINEHLRELLKHYKIPFKAFKQSAAEKKRKRDNESDGIVAKKVTPHGPKSSEKKTEVGGYQFRGENKLCANRGDVECPRPIH